MESYESLNKSGDYVMLDIDVATGKILNWKTPTDKEMLADMKE